MNGQGSVSVLLYAPTHLPQRQHWVAEDPLLAPTSNKAESGGGGGGSLPLSWESQVGWARCLPSLCPSLSTPALPSSQLPGCSFQGALLPHTGKGFLSSLLNLHGAAQAPSQVKLIPSKMMKAIVCLRSRPGSPT